jgi:hypothetical protein
MTLEVKKVFTIDVDKWLRGAETKDGSALKKGNKYCCLGLFLKDCGLTDEQLNGKASPAQIANIIPHEGKWLLSVSILLNNLNSQDCNDLMYVNDASTLPGCKQLNNMAKSRRNNMAKSRRRVMRKIFARNGYELRFSDES